MVSPASAGAAGLLRPSTAHVWAKATAAPGSPALRSSSTAERRAPADAMTPRARQRLPSACRQQMPLAWQGSWQELQCTQSCPAQVLIPAKRFESRSLPPFCQDCQPQAWLLYPGSGPPSSQVFAPMICAPRMTTAKPVCRMAVPAVWQVAQCLKAPAGLQCCASKQLDICSVPITSAAAGTHLVVVGSPLPRWAETPKVRVVK